MGYAGRILVGSQVRAGLREGGRKFAWGIEEGGGDRAGLGDEAYYRAGSAGLVSLAKVTRLKCIACAASPEVYPVREKERFLDSCIPDAMVCVLRRVFTL